MASAIEPQDNRPRASSTVAATVREHLTPGLIFVLLAIFSRMPRVLRRPIIDFGETAALVFDFELYKLLLLVPLAGLLIAGLLHPHRRVLRVDPPLLILLAFFGWALLSLSWALDPHYGIAWLARLVIPIAWYIAIINYTRTRHDLRAWTTLFAIMAIGDLVLAVAELPYGLALFGRSLEIARFIGIYARWGVIGFAFSLHLFTMGETRRRRILGLIGSIAGMVAVYFTFRRAAVLALAFVAVFYFVVIGRRSRQFVRLFVAVMVIGVAAILLDPSYSQRLASIPIIGGGEPGVATHDYQRAFQLAIGIRIFLDHWLLGVGMGNLMVYFSEFYTMGQKFLPHNIILEFGGELGIIGLAIFGAFVGTGLTRAWRTFRTHREAGRLSEASQVAAIMAALLAMLLYGQFQPIRYDSYIYLFTALCSVSWTLLPRSSRGGVEDSEGSADDELPAE